MRVESTNTSSAPLAQNDRVQQQPATQNDTAAKPLETKPAANKQDTIEVSRTSEQLNKTSAVNQESSFRADKVAQVKQSIEANSYQVNSRAVAEKMLYAFSRGPTA